MLAHASRNPSSGSRCVRHVPAVANVSPATGLIWPRVVGAKNRAILFGYERLFVTAHPVGQCLAFAHVRIEGVCSGFTNDWDDDRSDSRGVPGCGFSNMHALRLEIRGFCPQWVKSGKAQNEQMLSALPPKADIASSLDCPLRANRVIMRCGICDGLRSPAQKVYILHKKLSIGGTLCAKPLAREGNATQHRPPIFMALPRR